MEIKLNDLYILLAGYGEWEDHVDIVNVIVGREKAERVLNEHLSRACDSTGEVALYKAKLEDNIIKTDLKNCLAEKEWNAITQTWEDYKEDEDY